MNTRFAVQRYEGSYRLVDTDGDSVMCLSTDIDQLQDLARPPMPSGIENISEPTIDRLVSPSTNKPPPKQKGTLDDQSE